jgi:hypothetical protein
MSIYHLPTGHTAIFTFTLAGIMHIHLEHCLVRFMRSGHSLQIVMRAWDTSSVACSCVSKCHGLASCMFILPRECLCME